MRGRMRTPAKRSRQTSETLTHRPKTNSAPALEALFDFEQVSEEGRLFLLNRGMANAYAECLTISGKRSDAGKASAKARIKKNRIAKIPTEGLKEAA